MPLLLLYGKIDQTLVNLLHWFAEF